jgi:hypothetical protein
MDPDWMDGFSRGQVMMVWLHELDHLTLGYFSRVLGLDEDDFNVAHDHAVNLGLNLFLTAPVNQFLGLAWPGGEDAPLMDPRFRGMIAEEIYNVIRAQRAKARACKVGGGGGRVTPHESGSGGAPGTVMKSPDDRHEEGDHLEGAKGACDQRGSGDGGDEPGKGGVKGAKPTRGGRDGGFGYRDRTDCVLRVGGSGAPGSGGAVDAAEQDRIHRQAERLERLLQEALAIQEQRGIGTVPGEYVEIIRKILKPRVDWFSQLMHYVQGPMRGGGLTYARLSKRSEALGISMPGHARRRPRVCAAWDTSMSVGTAEAQNFAGAVRQIGDILDAEMRCIQIDVNIQSDEIIEDFDAMDLGGIEFHGRGGTDFSLLPPYLEECGEEIPDLLLLFTDGEVDWPSYELWPCRVIVVTVNRLAPPPYLNVKLQLAV